MYLQEIGLFIVEIPKCGTNTLKALESIYTTSLPGHIPVSVAKKTLGHDFDSLALIRDPWERFTSALNYVYGDEIALEDAMNGALRHDTIVLKPQISFIDETTRLFPFEALPEVVRALGYEGKTPHENASRKRWSVRDIQAQARASEVGARYYADFAIRDSIGSGSGGIPSFGRGKAR